MSAAATAEGKAVGGGARRIRAAARSALVVAAAAVSLVLLNIIAESRGSRLDVTATREHQLSPRTARLLTRLGTEPYEVVVAAPMSGASARVDRASKERVSEVLDQIARGAPSLKATMIDTASAEGLEQFGALIRRLAEREADRVRAREQEVAAGCTESETLAQFLDGLADSLGRLRDGLPTGAPETEAARAYFERRSGECRASGRALREAAGKARQAMKAPGGDLPVPDAERAAAPLRDNLRALETGLADIASNLDLFVKAENMPAPARDGAKPLAAETAKQRDRAASARDRLDRIPPLDLARVAGAVKADAAALVIGPPGKGVTAVDMDSLFPAHAAMEAGSGLQADLRRGSEELFATALAALAEPVKPVLVIVHGEAAKVLGQGSEFSWALSRLALRGVDVIEWATATDPAPSLTRFGDRPIVYATLTPDTAQPAGPRGQPAGADRAVRLGKAIDSLVGAGQNLLISFGPSTLPSYGEADPTVACLAKFGLKADTSHPILRDRFVQGRRIVEVGQPLLAAECPHPIYAAVRGLNTHFDWPLPLREPDGGDVHAVALFRIDDARSWGEADWLGYWQVPWEQRGAVIDPPDGSSARDDAKGPWTVAAAAERSVPGRERPQRVVVVASNAWFKDWVTRAGVTMVDGRYSPANPGNLELLEASIYWLSGQEGMIGQSATARAVPLIAALPAGGLTALRWGAAAGLPALVLLLGALWRAFRG